MGHPIHTPANRPLQAAGPRDRRTGAALTGLSYTAHVRRHSQMLGNHSSRGVCITTEVRQPHKVPLLPEGRWHGQLRRPWEKTPPPQRPKGRKGRHTGPGEDWGTGLAGSPGGSSRAGGEVARARQAREGRSVEDGRRKALTRRRGEGGGLHAQQALPGALPRGDSGDPLGRGGGCGGAQAEKELTLGLLRRQSRGRACGCAGGSGGSPKGTGAAAQDDRNARRVPGKEGNSREDGASSREGRYPCVHSCSRFQRPQNKLQRSHHRAPTRVPLPACSLPCPTKCRGILGPGACPLLRGSGLCCAPPPPCPGSTIGGGGGAGGLEGGRAGPAASS